MKLTTLLMSRNERACFGFLPLLPWFLGTGPFIIRCFNNCFTKIMPDKESYFADLPIIKTIHVSLAFFLSLVPIPVLLYVCFPIMYISFSSLESVRIVSIWSLISSYWNWSKQLKWQEQPREILSLTRFKSEFSLNPAHSCNSSSWSCEKIWHVCYM